MVTLVVENGSGLTNSNTYISNADADTYFGSHLYATDWTGATEGNQDIALAMATRLLDDHFDYNGKATKQDQALSWPRFDIHDKAGYFIPSTTIPTPVKNATAEFAKWLLAEDRTAEEDDRGFKSLKAGSLSLEIDPEDRKAMIPDIVASMLAEFGVPKSGGAAKVTR